MPKMRFISPSISTSEKVSRLSLPAKLLYTWFIPHADDQGRLPASPKKIKWIVCPNVDEITEEVIPQLIKEIKEADLLIHYKINDEVIQLKAWWEYQGEMKWAKRSKYPPPPGWEDRLKTPKIEKTSDDFPKIGETSPEFPKLGSKEDTKEDTKDKVSSKPLVSQAESRATKETKQKPHQREAGIFLDLVEERQGIMLLNRPKLIHIVRTKLFKIPDTTPERLYECFAWLRDNDLFLRNREPPLIISMMPDKYPDWCLGRLQGRNAREGRGPPKLPTGEEIKRRTDKFMKGES